MVLLGNFIINFEYTWSERVFKTFFTPAIVDIHYNEVASKHKVYLRAKRAQLSPLFWIVRRIVMEEAIIKIFTKYVSSVIDFMSNRPIATIIIILNFLNINS